VNSRFMVVETSLNRAEFRWKWLNILKQSALLGTLLCLGVLLFGEAILCGWVSSKAVALTFFALLGGVGFVVWAIALISVMACAPDRYGLAVALERVDHRLLDRLNTLLFLEKTREAPRSDSFSLRIAKQFHALLVEKSVPSPFSAYRALVHLLVFILTLTLTVLLYEVYRPWDQLLARPKPRSSLPVASGQPAELTLPTTNNVEQNQAWGEVRITEPGTDLKVTKVDVMPLQIEAAANHALKIVSWFSTLNGAPEASHSLAPPAESHYAVYQPTIYLDELQLSDWDVITYYATASTDQTNTYGSDVYFLEVRPFREDIAKLPGGEGGQAYHTLNEITTLINRQQHVIRQTHQHVQHPPEQEALKAQDRKKLADAEGDLSDSAQHLYAKMASQMENKPIGLALDQLAKAQKSLDSANKDLQSNTLARAQSDERQALSDLVTMRKMFQKAVTDNPDAFQENQQDEDTAPVADSFRKLSEMAEFRNEAKAAQELVQKTVDQQKNLAAQTRTLPRSDYSRLAAEEQQLEKSLENFQAQHPQVFKETQAESRQAQQAMAAAAGSLQNNKNEARSAMQQATRDLEKFSDALRASSAAQQLADAYRLKHMLDREINTLDRRLRPDSNVSDVDLQKTATEASHTVDQLSKTAEQDPTRDAFGQPLRDALSGQNKVDLQTKLKQLQLADDAASRQERAAAAKDGLVKVSRAFEQSEPKSLQAARSLDSLTPGDQDSFGQGISELQSLILQLENNRQIRTEDRARQGHQALMNLQSGLRTQHGDNERGNQLLVELEQILKAETPLEVADLKKLLDQLQHFSLETSERLARQDEPPEVSDIDPSRLPAAYRGRIQKYFEKLPEK